MGRLLDFYQAIETRKDKHVDRLEQDKEKAVEEAASLERDIDTLANTFNKALTVNLLGPIIRITTVAEGVAQQDLKIEVSCNDDDLQYAVAENDEPVASLSQRQFHQFIMDWLQQAR